MWPHGHSTGDAEEVAGAPQQQLVAVAIGKDKGSQSVLKWAVDNLLLPGHTIMLVHVLKSALPSSHAAGFEDSPHIRELFLPFRCFCTRKDVQCKNVILEDNDVAKALIEFITRSAVEKMVVGYPSRNSFIRRFKGTDIHTVISKGAPDFCSVYVVNKGRISAVRQAVRQAPAITHRHVQNSLKQETRETSMMHGPRAEAPYENHHLTKGESIKSPSSRGTRNMATKSYGELPLPEMDASFVSSGRPIVDRMLPLHHDHVDINLTSRWSNASNGLDQSLELTRTALHGSMDASILALALSTPSQEGGGTLWPSQTMEDIEEEMRVLKLELKQTRDMYNTAFKEAMSAKQMASELHRWKMVEEQRVEEARLAEGAALAIAENEKAKYKAATEAAEVAQRIAELEAQRRVNAEMKALEDAEEKKKALDALAKSDLNYRKYTIEEIERATESFAENRKIGEGGYGPVYKCHLAHTPVAIKVLRPDAAQGRSQFQQEVEVLSCIRHPNMVLLLGACPEYGCLVYEYMENGSLEDCLFRRDGTPALPWQLRFRIAAEIGTGLLFLHQTKPEPIVHRDLKPGNILLDKNYVSKISDVGLARLVPSNLADDVTQYRMTSTAGTFCYIDPEYQQTGMLGTKSDIYSLGVMLLQLITGKPPMGLTHHVERAIEKGTFEEMLDPAVLDWPVDHALSFARMSLRCAELRRKDRPDLATVVLPLLDTLRALADQSMHRGVVGCTIPIDLHSQTSMSDYTMSGPLTHSSYESTIDCSSASSCKQPSIA